MEFAKSTLSPAEAEILVRKLKPIDIAHVGSKEWKEQRVAVEQLNMCSHSNAALKKDDYVRQFLIDHEKVVVLLHHLLTMEVWRNQVLPNVMADICPNPSATYLYNYYESIVLNLLECIMYFEESVVAFGDDLLELLDYLWRQVSGYLAHGGAKTAAIEDPPTGTQAETSPEEHLKGQLFHQEAVRAMTSLSCLWFVVERINALPMAVSNNVLLKNDLILGLSGVMVQQIWVRRGSSGRPSAGQQAARIQKFVGGSFRDVAGDESLRVCVPEAHCWFILHKLLCDRECRKKYAYTSSKKEIILRIKRFLTETTVDQIPVLSDVQRALEELSFLEPPSGTEEKFRSSLIVEQVPRLMGAIDHRSRNWDLISREMSAKLRDPNSRRDDAVLLAQIFDQMFDGDEGQQMALRSSDSD